MDNSLINYLSGLPAFASHFGAALALLVAFAWVYQRVTPYDEIRLIRAGNVAAAASFGGTLVGFALPVASAIRSSVSFADMLLWALIALLAQLLAFGAVRLLVPDVNRNIEKGEVASGVLLGLMAVAVGLLNAASMAE